LGVDGVRHQHLVRLSNENKEAGLAAGFSVLTDYFFLAAFFLAPPFFLPPFFAALFFMAMVRSPVLE
jgi:hypothetical protein